MPFEEKFVPEAKRGLAAAELADARRGEREGEHVAERCALHRQLGDPRRIEPDAHFGRRPVDQGRVGAHFDALRQSCRLELDVHHGVLVEREGDPGTHVLREAALLDRQLVLAHRNVEEPIEAILLADRRSDCVRRDIPDCHRGAGHHRLLLVA